MSASPGRTGGGSRYRVAWTRLDEPVRASPHGTWLVAVPEGRSGDPAVAGSEAALRSAGTDVLRLEVDAEAASFAERVRAASPIEGVLSLLALDERPYPGHPAVASGTAA